MSQQSYSVSDGSDAAFRCQYCGDLSFSADSRLNKADSLSVPGGGGHHVRCADVEEATYWLIQVR